MDGADITEDIEDLSGEEAPEGFECRTAITPLDRDAVQAARHGKSIKVGYLAADRAALESGASYWDENDFGTARRCRTAAEREDAAQRAAGAGKLFFLFDDYEERGLHFVAHEDGRAYSPEDVEHGYLSVLVLSEALHLEYGGIKQKQGPEAAEQWLKARAEAIFKEYRRYMSGEVFQVVVETWERDGRYWSAAEDGLEACGGYIGLERGEERLREEFAEFAAGGNAPDPAAF